jgi:DNA gyrase/topoisomerase IV subunit A
MTTVRIPEGRPIPWRLIAGIVVGLVILSVLGWLAWDFIDGKNDEIAALKAEIAEQKVQYEVQIGALVAQIADLNERRAAEIADLNEEKAALEQEIVDLKAELVDCQDNVQGLVQRADRLETELDACLKELNQPRRVQVVLPELMRDNTTIIFVVDDSGSMSSEVLKMQEALQKMQEKLTVNAQVSMLLFGDSHTTLFNFTDPAAAPWEYAIGEIKAEHGGTDINLAMQTAFDSIKDEPNVNKRIVLLSDGHGFIDAATIATIAGANIPVDAVAFGPWADYAFMAKIAQATGGDLLSAQ